MFDFKGISLFCLQHQARHRQLIQSHSKRVKNFRKTFVQIFHHYSTKRRESPLQTESSSQLKTTLSFSASQADFLSIGNRVPRLFVAIFPPTVALDAITRLQERLKNEMINSRIKWVERPNLHVTLRFFGSVISEAKMFRACTDVITEVVSQMEPFELELKTVGVFPKWDKPRVLWIGLGQGKEELKGLVKSLEKGFRKAGIPEQQKESSLFQHPHLTIGRWEDIYVRTLQGDIAKDVCQSIQKVTSFKVHEVLMINSTLNENGPLYTPVFYARSMKNLTGVRRRSRYDQSSQ